MCENPWKWTKMHWMQAQLIWTGLDLSWPKLNSNYCGINSSGMKNTACQQELKTSHKSRNVKASLRIMHEEWEDYDRKQFLAWWAANSASQIKEIACNAPVQPRRKCCKLLLDEKDMKVKICGMKPFHAKPTTVIDISLSLCVYAAEINTFSLLSGLQFAIFF